MNTPNSIAEQTFYDPAIDGLRGVAILSVVFNHAAKCALQDPNRTFQIPYLEQFCKGGAGGVSLSFVLSALTLMISTRYRFSVESSPKLSFYIRRAFRILPLWWGFILISALVRCPSPSQIAPHLFMYFGFIPKMNFTHVGWSLFVEETFYLFFPLIFLMLLRRLGAVLFLAITLVLSDRIFTIEFFNVPSAFDFVTWIPVYHYVTFGLGIVCFHMLKSKESYSRKISSALSIWVWDLIAVFSVFGYFLFESHGNLQILSCFALVCATMVSGTKIRILLSAKSLRTFGVCCYSIYLFHGLFLYSIRYTTWFRSLGSYRFGPEFQLLVGFALAVGASYLFGMLSFMFFEKPCVDLAKRFVRSHIG